MRLEVLTQKRSAVAVAVTTVVVLLVAIFSGSNSTTATSPTVAATYSLPTTEMPLGERGLQEKRTSASVASGITHYQITRGETSSAEGYTVTIGFYKTMAAAATAAAVVMGAGYTVRYDSAGLDPDGRQLGYNLSVGLYSTLDEATSVSTAIAAATSNAYVLTVRYTGLDGATTTGPWFVNVLAISPTFKGNVKNIIASATIDGTGGSLGMLGETPQATAARLGAVAAINSGFWSTNENTAGVELKGPASAIVANGQLEAMAANGEAGVAFTQVNGSPSVQFLPNVSTTARVTSSTGASKSIDAINSAILGQIFSCGSPNAIPSADRAHDYTCLNYNVMVMYNNNYNNGLTSGTVVDTGYSGSTYEVSVDSKGQVLSGSTTLGAAPPNGGYVLQGLGKSATWLETNAPPGAVLTTASQLMSNGTPVLLSSDMTLTAAGPTLLPASTVNARALAEGWSPTFAGVDRSEFFWEWWNARNPRTMIGKTADGTILLVEVDGRQPGLSLGTTIPETADIMDWLGAISATNLDGGGSSVMIVNGALVGHPSDEATTTPIQRLVAESLVITE